MYVFETKVRYSETDDRLILTLPALAKYFQDTCIFEAEDGNINMEYLMGRKLAWVLGSWQIVMNRLPVLNEKIKNTTCLLKSSKSCFNDSHNIAKLVFI